MKRIKCCDTSSLDRMEDAADSNWQLATFQRPSLRTDLRKDLRYFRYLPYHIFSQHSCSDLIHYETFRQHHSLERKDQTNSDHMGMIHGMMGMTWVLHEDSRFSSGSGVELGSTGVPQAQKEPSNKTGRRPPEVFAYCCPKWFEGFLCPLLSSEQHCNSLGKADVL